MLLFLSRLLPSYPVANQEPNIPTLDQKEKSLEKVPDIEIGQGKLKWKKKVSDGELLWVNFSFFFHLPSSFHLFQSCLRLGCSPRRCLTAFASL